MEVMVVDDEPSIREIISEQFAGVGLSTCEMPSAEEALRTIADHERFPAVIVTDVDLGPGMDGVGLAAEVRRRWPAVFVVVVTGATHHLDRLPQGSCERTYIKPFEPRRLVADVQALLGCGN